MPLRHAPLTIVWLAFASGAGAQVTPARPSPSPCPEVIARVDGRPITIQAIGLIVELKRRANAGAGRPDVYQDALNLRIQRELLVGEAIRQGLDTEPVRVRDAEKTAREGFAEDKAWLTFLAQQGLDPETYRQEAAVEGRADTLMACELDKVPTPDDDETKRLFHLYVQPNSLEPPSPDALEHWRFEFRRKKRSMAGRELLMRLNAQAKIERYFEPGRCAP